MPLLNQLNSYVISYLLASNNKLSEDQRFEKLWKAFNRLYKQIGKKSTEFDCLIELKKIISKNPLIVNNSSQKVNNLNVKKLRDSIRWRAMILNDYDTESKTKAFRDFIMRHKDPRIMQIILDTNYGYRQDFFISKGFLNEIKTHVDTCIINNEISDVEIVTFLTGKYMYFVRNKMFHGETIDNSFRLSTNKKDIELKFLNDILESYITDLINI